MKYFFFTVSLLFSIFSFSQHKKTTQKKEVTIICKRCGNGEPLIIVDNKIITKNKFTKIDPNTIKSFNVYKQNTAIKLYGKKAKDGVIVVKLKSKKELRKEKRKANRIK